MPVCISRGLCGYYKISGTVPMTGDEAKVNAYIPEAQHTASVRAYRKFGLLTCMLAPESSQFRVDTNDLFNVHLMNLRDITMQMTQLTLHAILDRITVTI